MLFNVLIFVLFAAIAYFQYVQGLFSAALSAVLCILASVLAMGYYELLTPYLMKIPEEADAVAILGIFFAAYVVLRLLMDNLVPGNVRFPLLVDKIGAGVMGVIAGLFATGTFAIAAQSMPFDTSIGGFSRQDLQDRANVTIMGDASYNGRAIDSQITDELVGDKFGDPSHVAHLWLHQDDLVLAFAQQFSDPGSAMANDHPWEQVHPDYLLELFSQRIGTPVGSKRVAIDTDKDQPVKLDGAYAITKPIPPKLAIDDELSSVRGEQQAPDVPSPGDTVLAVVRITFTANQDMTDSDGFLRFSPCSLRLVAGNKDYFPIGTMVAGTLLLKNRPDDPMMIDLKSGAATVDFLFPISQDDMNLKTEGKEKKISFKPGSFVDFKRYAVMDLHQMELGPQPTDFNAASLDKQFESTRSLGGVMRKIPIGTEAVKVLTGYTPTVSPTAARDNAQPQSKGPRNNSDEYLPNLPNHQMGF